jgi:DNA-binding CsgD family transcriptional regulator
MALEVLTRSRLSLGRRDEARRTAALAAAAAAAVDLPMPTAWACRAAAAVAVDAAEPAVGAQRALAAAAAAERAGAVIEAALSRTLAGQALARAGSHGPAAVELERAAADLDACGALRHRDAAERELRKLGRHIHRRSRRGTGDGTGMASLTERELQLARLVVDRRTNREIATELFLSRKTVETHLRHIFRKLDVSSRVELARAVERADRAEPTA